MLLLDTSSCNACCFLLDLLELLLQEVIDAVQQQATAEGAFGRGTSRYLDPARPDVQLPAGAAWCTVRVKSVFLSIACLYTCAVCMLHVCHTLIVLHTSLEPIKHMCIDTDVNALSNAPD